MSGGTARNELRGDAGSGAAPLKLEEFLPYRLNVVASLVFPALSRIYCRPLRHRRGGMAVFWSPSVSSIA